MRHRRPPSSPKIRRLSAFFVLGAAALVPLNVWAESGSLIVGSKVEIRRVEVAIARARVQRVKTRILDDFARSRFNDCIALATEAIEGALSLLRSEDDFDLLREFHLWQGACEAALGATEQAEQSFLRAKNIAGQPPDPKLFPPKILALYEEVSEPQTCDIALAPEIQLVGANPVSDSTIRLSVGEHAYAAVDHSGSISVDPACAVRLQRFVTDASLRDDEVSDADFLEQLSLHLGYEELILVPHRGAPKRFDPKNKVFSEVVPSPAAVAREPRANILESPVFWIVLAVAIGGSVGITAAAMSSSSSGPEPGTMTRIQF